MMTDLLKTKQTYATRANALKRLTDVVSHLPEGYRDVRYLIAVTEDGRFAPVVVLSTTLHGYINFLAGSGITVVS